MQVAWWKTRVEPVIGVYRRVSSRPSWVTRATLLTFLLIVGLPLLALILVALTVSLVVLTALSLVNFAATGARRAFIGARCVLSSAAVNADGRRNVRVIPHAE